jgi:hypothetical protein
MSNKSFAGLVLATALPLQAFAAGGHYPVDDADIVGPGEFQIESWLTRFDADNSELAVLPAWTPRGTALELTAGLIRIEEDGDSFNRFEPAAKWQFSPIEPGRMAAAVAVQLGYEDGSWADLLVNLPLSFELPDAPLTLHANLGWIHDRSEGKVDRLFLGGAFEWDLNDSIGLIGQVYREGADEEPEAQLGLRFALGGAAEHLDIAAGRQLRGEQDWFLTVGLGLAF